jgi:hypothetical protein
LTAYCPGWTEDKSAGTGGSFSTFTFANGLAMFKVKREYCFTSYWLNTVDIVGNDKMCVKINTF